MAKPGEYAKGFEKMQRNDKLLRDFAEEMAKGQCVLPGSKSCQEKDGYSRVLWCAPCLARDTLEKVNAKS